MDSRFCYPRMLACLALFYCTHFSLAAQESEDVLFFDASANQTSTSEGGGAIWSFESNEWRWWLRGAKSVNISPDGGTVLYTYNGNLYSLGINETSGRKLIAEGPGNGQAPSHPKWSPLCDRISYVIEDTLYIAETDGSSAQSIYEWRNNWQYRDRDYAWSPDGERIVLVGSEKDAFGNVVRRSYKSGDYEVSNVGLNQLVVLDISSGLQTPLLLSEFIWGQSMENFRERANYYSPKWSPDGKKIAIEVYRVTNDFDGHNVNVVQNVAIIPAAGGSLEYVTDFPLLERDSLEVSHISAWPAAWSPDSSKLAYFYYRVSDLDNSGTYITDFENPPARINRFTSRYTQWITLNGNGAKFTVSVPDEVYKPEDIIEATIRIRSLEDEPVTIMLDDPILSVELDGVLMVDEEEVNLGPYVLSRENPTVEIKVLMLAESRDIVDIFASGTLTDSTGTEFILVDSETVVIEPLTTEIKITPEETGALSWRRSATRETPLFPRTNKKSGLIVSRFRLQLQIERAEKSRNWISSEVMTC